MATDRMKICDLLEYLSDVEDTRDSFTESRIELLGKIKEQATEHNCHEILKVELADLVSTVENDAFICGIYVGVKLKNILDRM